MSTKPIYVCIFTFKEYLERQLKLPIYFAQYVMLAFLITDYITIADRVFLAQGLFSILITCLAFK